MVGYRWLASVIGYLSEDDLVDVESFLFMLASSDDDQVRKGLRQSTRAKYNRRSPKVNKESSIYEMCMYIRLILAAI